MPLILAIEPDRRQASHLTAMVRGRLHAEFVIGDSAQHALEALGSRVPDLVLTTALLSPKDESALGDRLRALDGAAAHVQTLTIPMLASPGRGRRGVKPSGMLSVLLGDKSDSDAGADGCDPAVFAEQCKEYLERAAHERAQAVEHMESAREAPVAATAEEPRAPVYEPIVPVYEPIVPAYEPMVPAYEPIVAAYEPIVSVRTFFARTNDDEPPSSLMAAVAAFAEDELSAGADGASSAVDAVNAYDTVDTAENVEATQELETASTIGDDEELTAHYEFVDVDLSSMLDDPNRVRTPGGRDASDAGDPGDNDERALEVYEIDSNVLDPSDLGETQPAMAASADEPATTVSAFATYTPLPRPEVRTWPILEGLATGAVSADANADIDIETPEPAAVRETVELVEWSDIIEALRRDAQPAPVMRERPPSESGEPVEIKAVEPVEHSADDEPVAAALEAVPPAPEPESASPEAPNGNGRRRRRKSPVQDEWGFFDPDRAGFSALLAKLEEITEDDTAQPQRT